MFSNLFAKYRKIKVEETNPLVKTDEELTQDFALLKVKYAQIANSDLYKFFVEYYLARLEINRDLMEGLNPFDEKNRTLLLQAQSEAKVIRKFIKDIEDMHNNMVEPQSVV
jgi:hypothetical protein